MQSQAQDSREEAFQAARVRHHGMASFSCSVALPFRSVALPSCSVTPPLLAALQAAKMTVGEAVQMVRRKINQTISGGPGGMLRAFKAFRLKSGSDDNQVSDETLPLPCSSNAVRLG